MRHLCFLALVISALAPAQELVTRTVPLANATPQGLQEAATALRQVCKMTQVSVDEASSSIIFTDTPATAELAEWTLTAITAGATAEPREYKVPAGADDAVKVVYLRHTLLPQDLQEAITQVRQVLEIHRVYNFSPNHALLFRGTASQVAAATWLVAQLDKPFDPNAAAATYQMEGAKDGDTVRVYYLHNVDSPKEVQRVITTLRTEIGARHVFVSSTPRAIALRGASELVAQADAIVSRMDVQRQ